MDVWKIPQIPASPLDNGFLIESLRHSGLNPVGLQPVRGDIGEATKKPQPSGNIEPWFEVVDHGDMDHYTIGQLAKTAGVPTSSVRYYERRGLLAPDERSEGNYRLFGEAALERLRFIRAAQAAGFTLSNIDLLLEFRDGDADPHTEVQQLITSRLSKVETEIEHLGHVLEVLKKWMDVCRRAARTGRCGVLDDLGTPGCCGPETGRRAKRKRIQDST